MGSSVYALSPNKDGVIRYQSLVRVKGYKDRNKKFDRREEAQAWADEQMAEINLDRAARGDPKFAAPETGDFVDEPLSKTLELFWKQKSTHQQQQILPALTKHVDLAFPTGEQIKVGQLTERWIEDYIALMRKTLTVRKAVYSYSTILKQMTIVKAAIKWRARRLQLKSVPEFNFTTTEFFPKDWKVERERRLEIVEERTLRQLFRSMDEAPSVHWRLIMRFALETCARQGEIVKATWSEIQCVNGFWFWTIPKKHNKSKRTRVVPLNVNAVRVLTFLRRMQSPNDPRLFHFFKTPGVVSKEFHDWVLECSIENLKWHDLRHESITRFVLRERNFTVDEIMKIVGHKSRDMLDLYTNVRGDELAAKLMRRAPSVPRERSKILLRLLELAQMDDADVLSSKSVNDDHFDEGRDHAA